MRGERLLTDLGLRKLEKTPGRHKDGGGLMLVVDDQRARWVFRFTLAGKERGMGLGAYPDVSLATARARRDEARVKVQNGVDPIADRKVGAELAKRIPTFAEAARGYIEKHGKAWNEKHRGQWIETTGPQFCAQIANEPVSEITTLDVEKLLMDVHAHAPITAHRLRGRIQIVIDEAWRIHKWVETFHNPAAFRKILPQRETAVRHHPALAYAEIPEFVAQLQRIDSVVARALEMVLLTATRAGEVLGARWEEIDFEKMLWTIPADRMKGRAGRRSEHQIPLSDRALEILRQLADARDGDYVFPGREGGHLSVNSLIMRLRRMRPGMTVHGFRSTFRDWAGDCTETPREIAEAALAHKIGGVEGSYRRGTALQRRARLMEAWEAYATGRQSPANVVDLDARRVA
jgi:integrase